MAQAMKAAAAVGGELLSYSEDQNTHPTVRGGGARMGADRKVVQGGNHYELCVLMAERYMAAFDASLQAQGVDSDSWRAVQAVPVIAEDE